MATQAREVVGAEGETGALAGLYAALEQVNAGLGEFTPYKLDLVKPGDIMPTPKNAHYMPKRVFDTLTGNIERDGNLSSLPLCWRRDDGRYELLSGNHRVESAKKAGVGRILILYTDRALSEGQRISIQLSHNALVGLDNPTQLRELWDRIDSVDWKVYSGLDDELLATLAPVKVESVREAPLQMEELTILFLPAEVERLKELVKRLGSAKRTRLAAPLAAWDPFFEALLDYKEATGILNTGTALLGMAEIVREWLDARAAEAAEAQPEGTN